MTETVAATAGCVKPAEVVENEFAPFVPLLPAAPAAPCGPTRFSTRGEAHGWQQSVALTRGADTLIHFLIMVFAHAPSSLNMIGHVLF